MKKNTLLLFIFMTTFMVGQDKLTSNIEEYYDGANWIISNKIEYTYDNNRNLTKSVDLYWQTSQWVKSYASIYTYNSNNKVIAETYENYDVNGNITGTQERTLNTYNSNGDLSQILNQTFLNSNWVNEGKFDLTYTSNRLSSAIGYEWNGSTWFLGQEDSFRITFSYNSNGNVSVSKSDEWNGTNWVDSDRTIFTYDGNNRVIIDEGQIWNGTNWATDYKSEYTYDANGNTVTEIESYLDNGILTVQPLVTITFDTTKLMSSFSHPFRDKTGLDVLFPTFSVVNKISGKSSTNSRTTYYYGNEPTASVSDFATLSFTAYPNPTKDFITIDTANSKVENIVLFNVLGRKVFSSNKKELDIRNLSKGVYILKVKTTEGKIASKRIIKN
ncbi:T9SS type A sorting domain-containing protein [Polaribacter sp. PL03]|uniref:T9SS type A sorting domain-containing protein n=1 Tax=Polaribacter sp. PL03 TaxID=3088353 RepID=UPI0029D33794|nr:T9SS type A sorting domain-containing protein [Polaribacter sp. PL03]MDX6747801.1 T9SS type A sorting domain-containing protein [Polaribacter sp. PL03]